MRYLRFGIAALAAAVLAACGGGGAGDQKPKVQISAVKVMGDSLADSGVFGFKFNVQNAADPAAGFPIWTERIAQSYGVPALCPVFRATGPTTFAAPVLTCSSFAIGGGRINSLANSGGPTAPYSIPYQMTVATAAGNFAPSDLVLIDGGGNDAADLIGAYLAAPSDGGAAYGAMLTSLLPPATVQATLAQQNGAVTAGGLYMVALADKFKNDIATQVLGKGAQRVALLNMPAVTNTPRFKFVLQAIEASAGATAAGQAKAVFDGWTKAFNDRLTANFSGESRVALVDFFTSFNDQVNNPAQFGLTNVTTPACPAGPPGADGLPTYDFSRCTSAALDASTPGWKTYGFSDGFHPTPFGYQLLAQLVSLELARKGWL
ncbi:MAG: SGNH/GDSL hydrolase family protein [Burkholderiaceae bacterium]